MCMAHCRAVTSCSRYYVFGAFVPKIYESASLSFAARPFVDPRAITTDPVQTFIVFYIGNFCAKFCSEMWCWRRMEMISWTNHVRNEEVLLRVNEQRNILHEIRKRKANWIGHILCRNCLLEQVIEGKIKGQI